MLQEKTEEILDGKLHFYYERDNQRLRYNGLLRNSGWLKRNQSSSGISHFTVDLSTGFIEIKSLRRS